MPINTLRALYVKRTVQKNSNRTLKYWQFRSQALTKEAVMKTVSVHSNICALHLRTFGFWVTERLN